MKLLESTVILNLLMLCTVHESAAAASAERIESPQTMAKLSKSFYQTHPADISKEVRERNPRISPNEFSDGSSHEVSNEVECHRVAVSRCGHILIRVYKFLDYLNARESFQPRCAFREAFFKCMKVSKEKFCSHRKSTRDHLKFRERLAKTLWSTRTCILGSLDYYY